MVHHNFVSGTKATAKKATRGSSSAFTAVTIELNQDARNCVSVRRLGIPLQHIIANVRVKPLAVSRHRLLTNPKRPVFNPNLQHRLPAPGWHRVTAVGPGTQSASPQVHRSPMCLGVHFAVTGIANRWRHEHLVWVEHLIRLSVQVGSSEGLLDVS